MIIKIKSYIKKGQSIVLESTVYPGATYKVIGNILKLKKFNIGKDIFYHILLKE